MLEIKSVNYLVAAATFILFAVASSAAYSDSVDSKATYEHLKWIDLMPEQDQIALAAPPAYLYDIKDGSKEDNVKNLKDDPYQKALSSARVVARFNNLNVRAPGFIVPLEFNDKQLVTEFFLVPYFGACIHEPPPPPNQTIFVSYPEGLKVESLNRPIWALGTLKTKRVDNEVAISAYSLEMHRFEPYGG